MADDQWFKISFQEDEGKYVVELEVDSAAFIRLSLATKDKLGREGLFLTSCAACEKDVVVKKDISLLVKNIMTRLSDEIDYSHGRMEDMVVAGSRKERYYHGMATAYLDARRMVKPLVELAKEGIFKTRQELDDIIKAQDAKREDDNG